MSDNITLPPLPRGDVYVRGSTIGQPMWAFSEIKLLAFARAAVLAERERIACMLYAEHEKRKAWDNHAAVYAAMIREMK